MPPMASASAIKSATRVFEVLELFRRDRRELSAAEVGRELGYPKSSTNALLKCMVSLGYLVADRRSMCYFPALSITQLGDWIPSHVLASGEALNVIEDIHAATKETVTLTVQNDLTCRFMRVVPGTFPISLRLTEGLVAPLFGTAVGIAIVSQIGDDDIASLVERHNERARRRPERVELSRVMKDVASMRERGYVVVYDALFPDTGAVAAPFPSESNAFPMAIGVGGLRDRIRRNEAAIVRAIRGSLVRYAARSGQAPRPRRRRADAASG